MGLRPRAATILIIGVVLAALMPAPVLGASWSKPRVVGSSDCSTVAATIDAAGRYHLAAGCGGSIRYSVSGGDGHWTTRVFVHPFGLRDVHPQIAIDGNFVYVAYSRVDTAAGGCDDGLVRLAVFYRRRSLPNGEWSAARKIGLPADELDAFEVAGGIVHATLRNAIDQDLYYETIDRGASHRYVIPGADGASLRIGTDGRTRMAYPLAGSIRYGMFNGSGFWKSRVSSSSRDSAPSLALGEDDRAYLFWTRSDVAFCGADPVISPDDGTYFATNKSGTWTSRRISIDLGTTSVTVNPSTGRVYGLLATEAALIYYTASATGEWSHTTLGPGFASSPVIRQDATTGMILVAYISEHGVNVITRG